MDQVLFQIMGTLTSYFPPSEQIKMPVPPAIYKGATITSEITEFFMILSAECFMAKKNLQKKTEELELSRREKKLLMESCKSDSLQILNLKKILSRG